VDLVLHTGSIAAFAGYRAHRQLAQHALRQDGSKVPLLGLRGKPLIALAGIANPQNFFTMLRAQGLQLAQTIALPDHFSFNDWHVSLRLGETLLCTEKDAAKLWLSQPTALAVPPCSRQSYDHRNISQQRTHLWTANFLNYWSAPSPREDCNMTVKDKN
jgi:tetraacyldisaccharide 4'-kinase